MYTIYIPACLTYHPKKMIGTTKPKTKSQKAKVGPGSKLVQSHLSKRPAYINHTHTGGARGSTWEISLATKLPAE